MLKAAVDKAFSVQIKWQVSENEHLLCDDEHILKNVQNDINVEECDATEASFILCCPVHKILQQIQDEKIHHSPLTTQSCYSVLKLFTGFAIAAFMAWKLMVTKAISMATKTAKRNIHQLISTLYA